MADKSVFDADAHYEQYTMTVRRSLKGAGSASEFVDELIAKGIARRALNMTAQELSARSKKGWETRRRRGGVTRKVTASSTRSRMLRQPKSDAMPELAERNNLNVDRFWRAQPSSLKPGDVYLRQIGRAPNGTVLYRMWQVDDVDTDANGNVVVTKSEVFPDGPFSVRPVTDSDAQVNVKEVFDMSGAGASSVTVEMPIYFKALSQMLSGTFNRTTTVPEPYRVDPRIDERIGKGLGRRMASMTAQELSARSKKGWETRRRKGGFASGGMNSASKPKPQVSDLLYRTKPGDPSPLQVTAKPYDGKKPRINLLGGAPKAGDRVSIGGGKSVVFPAKRPTTDARIARDIDLIKSSFDPDIDFYESEYENVSYSVSKALLNQFKNPDRLTRQIIDDIGHIAGMRAAKAAGFKG